MGACGGSDFLMNELTFTWEPITHLLSCGLHDLGHQHWLEGAPDKESFPYDPNWEVYHEIENANMFKIVAVRWRGHLVGYAGVRIFESMQSRGVMCSYIQEYYISPKFRTKGMSGIKLFRFIHEQLQLMRVYHVTVEQRDIVRAEDGGLDKFFDHLGYESHGKMRTKRLARVECHKKS